MDDRGAVMIHNDIAKSILFDPLSQDVNELYIVSGYATPTMLSWYIKNLYHKTQTPIRIYLLVGIVPFDGVSVSVHEGFIQLVRSEQPQEIAKLECSLPHLFILICLSGPKMELLYWRSLDLHILCRAPL